jgi:hypothetical protein
MANSPSSLAVGSGGEIPAISRQEAERIRMRIGDAALVGEWLERAGRIKSPAAPEEGPLAPTETGWLVARGDLKHRLWPWLGGAAAAGGSAAVVLALALVKPLLRLSVRHAPVLALAALGAGLAAAYGLSRLLLRGKLARWGRTAVPYDPAGKIPEGTRVRLVGRIADQPTVTTLFRERPAVLARNRVGDADETRGHDFEVELEGGARITVEARGALLLDPLVRVERPACGPVHPVTTKDVTRIQSDFLMPAPFWTRWSRPHEASVGPGDLVEVIGTLARTPGLAIYDCDDTPLLVRRIDVSAETSRARRPGSTMARDQVDPPG